MDTSNQQSLDQSLQERFSQLPKVVQEAITSADVQKELRKLAETQKLHLDQWQVLENDVMLTLLGFQLPDELPKHLEKDLEISVGQAKELADAVSRIVFQPIRDKLEKELDRPRDSVPTSPTESKIEQKPQPTASTATPADVTDRPAVAPATPAAPPPEGKATRAPVSEAYKAGETSVSRKSVDDDPYRESVS